MAFGVDRSVFTIFVEETEHRIELIGDDLGMLGSSTVDPQVLHSLFRHTHSLKSAANLLHIVPVEEIANRLEDILSLAREERVDASDPMMHALLRSGFDHIAHIIQNPHLLKMVNIKPLLERLDSYISQSS